MKGIHGDEEEPEEDADDPRMPCRPELDDKLGSGKIRGHGHGVVEPIIPRQCEAVPRGEESYRISVERTF